MAEPTAVKLPPVDPLDMRPFHPDPAVSDAARHSPQQLIVRGLLGLMAKLYTWHPRLRDELRIKDGWIDLVVGIRTRSGSVRTGIRFRDGKAKAMGRIPEAVDVVLVFKSDAEVTKFLTATPTEQVLMTLRNDFYVDGNTSSLNLFVYLISRLLFRQQIKNLAKDLRNDNADRRTQAGATNPDLARQMRERADYRIATSQVDPGVKYLEDPYLRDFSLKDFPRLAKFLNRHLDHDAEVCPELPKLLTEWHRKHGFERDSKGKPWHPVLRKALAYQYVMENRRPIIHANDLIAGTTTTKETGVVVYPEGHGTMIWGELLTVPHRPLNPYGVSEETRELLHKDVFPYWSRRNFKEWVRDHYRSPLGQRIDDRFAVYFDWKTATISHTIPDFPKMLRLGTSGIIAEIEEAMAADSDEERNTTRRAFILALEGLGTYSRHLAAQAAYEAERESDPSRAAELRRLAEICSQVVVGPARTLDEAVNSVWITWVGLHMESTNAGLSMGRLDQWLQPYFEADMGKLETLEQRRAYTKRAIELVGDLMLRCTDHLPLTPDVANYYFGGSSSDQAITLGGVTPEGEDAVCDMTYIFLKVTEILSLRDPNVNARFHLGKNSQAYLKRLCEVNLITAATPSLHNDEVVGKALSRYGYEVRDVRDWAATGCVEPTLSGKHIGHTNFQMLSLVAALEMALNDGWHPLMDWKVGPSTGSIEAGDFANFDQFFEAYRQQVAFLVDRSIEYNEMLGKAHQQLRPTPLLSSLIEGTIASGKDVTYGGARYNSSGAACIGLVDVIDSMLVIQKLVFEQRVVSFADLKRAVDTNFANDPLLLAQVSHKVALFGSGNEDAVAMGNRITKMVQSLYDRYTNYRGGRYAAGFWSMSTHVSYGTLAGALPSGRLAGKPFTPGLTPTPGASPNLLDNIRDVARLDPANMPNNIAFNVKVVPSAHESRERTVDTMAAYVKSYFSLGGMQMQLNAVTSDTLRDAMVHPENYRNLLVRISGYNAYFVTLNKQMQLELIERAEYGI
ncbi:MAG TPA: pyruvate formate lyase family protein [Polyangiaceae bacterium]|nr:pyruvate formate lyase family protein [Polyangiaceae bacterium]